MSGGGERVVETALIDACESATCPCGHVALDHAWHGCESCLCNRSGIHAVLASGVVHVEHWSTNRQCACGATSMQGLGVTAGSAVVFGVRHTTAECVPAEQSEATS